MINRVFYITSFAFAFAFFFILINAAFAHALSWYVSLLVLFVGLVQGVVLALRIPRSRTPVTPVIEALRCYDPAVLSPSDMKHVLSWLPSLDRLREVQSYQRRINQELSVSAAVWVAQLSPQSSCYFILIYGYDWCCAGQGNSPDCIYREEKIILSDTDEEAKSLLYESFVDAIETVRD